MKHDETIECEAREYASCTRRDRAPAVYAGYIAGAQAERKRAEKLVEALRWLAEDSQKYAGTDAATIARRAIKDWEGQK